MATSKSPTLEVDVPSHSEILEWCNDPDRKIVSREGQTPEVIRKGTFAIKHGRVSSNREKLGDLSTLLASEYRMYSTFSNRTPEKA